MTILLTNKRKKNLYLILASENLSGKPQIYFSKPDFAGALCKQKFSISHYYNVMPILTLPLIPRYKHNICFGKGKTLILHFSSEQIYPFLFGRKEERKPYVGANAEPGHSFAARFL